MKKASNSELYALGTMRVLIVAMMREEGRDFETCEICTKPIPPKKFDIHHTKYKGSTYYDLQIVCRKCNLAQDQMNLA